jgi:phosphatidylserine/phosphatidylglycerophosphate/cardiolipin synthase-like enzyme
MSKWHLFIIIAYITTIGCNAFAQPQFEDAFAPNQGATALVVKTINESQQSIRVAAYYFSSHPITEALIAAYDRGVDVKVVMDESNKSSFYSSLKPLLDAKVPTRTNNHYAIMHNKFMIIDGITLEIGSFNYTKSAEERNAENVLVIKDAGRIAGDYQKQWDKLWEESAASIVAR